MTKAHIGSRLNLKNMVHSLPEGMILFPLDGRVYDTKNQIPVLLNTTTIREDEKKFFASIAVEDGTTNQILSQNMFGGPNGLSSYYYDPILKEWSMTIPSGSNVSWRGLYYTGTNAIANPGQKQAFSFEVYSDDVVPVYIDVNNFGVQSSTGSNDNDIVANRRFYTGNTIPGKWVRMGVVIEFSSSNTQPFYNQSRIIFDNGFIPTKDTTIKFRKVQCEIKDHFTSFVEGTRPVGNLKYDISSLGMRDAGCVSCWIYNSDSMVNNRATGGVVNNQYLIKLGSYKYNNWYDDAMTLWIENITPRKFKFWSSSTTGSGSHSSDHIQSINTVDQYGGVGSWNHFVIQWDKNGLPSGNKKEFYINGVLQGGNSTTALPNNILTYLHLGAWADNDDGLKPCTMFEQLAIHPSKGFSPEVIQNWYESQTPFFDVHDQMFIY